jgi:polyisoprenoid-binding protein YceI
MRRALKGHDFSRAEKGNKVNWALVLKGHDFSRAEKANKVNWALAPEGRSSIRKTTHETVSRSNAMKSFAVFALAFVLAPAALAQHQTFVVNPDASEIKITLNTTHEVVNGTFHIQSGSIEFDRTAPKMSGSVVVLAGSGKTGNDSRDKKMNKDILKVEQYATVSFEPKTYNGVLALSGDSTIQVTGIFTLLGTPHEITIPIVVHLEGTTATAKTHFVVPYVQWGLKNPSFLIWKAEDNVAIDLSFAGRLAK